MIAMHPETKHSSAEDARPHRTHPESRQRRDGTDRVTKDTVRSREKVSSSPNVIFTFSDAMG